ncbi:hypothetical protein EU522_00955 [Candidatus Thorarchaeota archaeon]|nr:MAG: hypothetical protein EU522_00955 [Candidatus Thorarchaeota archaeon]
MAGQYKMKRRNQKEGPKEKEEFETAEVEQENAMKVVQIMQVVSEDLGDEEKRMWRKMLGVNDES